MTPLDPRLQLIAAQARVRPPHVFHCWPAMRTLGKGFHPDAFALFTGLEVKHIMAIIAALSEHNALPDGRSKPEARATRLPHDFKMPEEWTTWAIAKRHWSPDETKEEADLFTNYWQAKAGRDAAKGDWFKTWQNWTKTSRRPDGSYNVNTGTMSRSEQLEQAIRTYERMGRGNETADWRRELAELETNVVPLRGRN